MYVCLCVLWAMLPESNKMMMMTSNNYPFCNSMLVWWHIFHFAIPSLVRLCIQIRSGCQESPLLLSWNCIILEFYQSSYTAPSVGQLPRKTYSRFSPRSMVFAKANGNQMVWNDEVRRTTGQPRLSAIVNERDAKILTAALLEKWRRPPGRSVLRG